MVVHTGAYRHSRTVPAGLPTPPHHRRASGNSHGLIPDSRHYRCYIPDVPFTISWLDPETIVVILANTIGAMMAIPQAARVIRTRRVEGVSLTWAAMSVVNNAWWVIYAIGVGNLAIIPVAAICVAGYLVIIAGLVLFGGAHQPLRALGSSVAIGLAPLVALQLAGWPAAGIVLGLLYAVQLAPAVSSAVRNTDLAGISAGTWVIAIVEAALWGIYGTGRADLGLISMSATGVVMSAVVLFRVARWRSTQVALVN